MRTSPSRDTCTPSHPSVCKHTRTNGGKCTPSPPRYHATTPRMTTKPTLAYEGASMQPWTMRPVPRHWEVARSRSWSEGQDSRLATLSPTVPVRFPPRSSLPALMYACVKKDAMKGASCSMLMRCIRLCSIRKSSTMRGGELQANSFSLPMDFTIADFGPPHNYHIKGSPFTG